jgi:type 1 glutamine amidotransferase
MFHRPRRSVSALFVLAALASGPAPAEEPRIKVLIIDGQNNHNWKDTTPLLKANLVQSGRFSVEVATTPPPQAAAAEWDSFHPNFAKYQVILSNYNGQPWPKPVQKAFEEYVAGGGGVVIVHAANNAFPDWPEYNQMIGLGWRSPRFGDRLTVDESGKVVRTPRGEGLGSGHGPPHPYVIKVRTFDHPITKGMPGEWMHARDELYHGQRGPAEHMEILATAYSDRAKEGTGANEPMIWVIPYGKGRVFTTVMGHAMGRDTTAMHCIGFKTVILRGAEWAATGKVTIPIPANFPPAGEVRRDDAPGR